MEKHSKRGTDPQFHFHKEIAPEEIAVYLDLYLGSYISISY